MEGNIIDVKLNNNNHKKKSDRSIYVAFDFLGEIMLNQTKTRSIQTGKYNMRWWLLIWIFWRATNAWSVRKNSSRRVYFIFHYFMGVPQRVHRLSRHCVRGKLASVLLFSKITFLNVFVTYDYYDYLLLFILHNLFYKYAS